nr:hypothetical protein [Tanacetum cinerariifolium]
LFKFASKASMDQVLEKGPWLIRKSPIILNKWTPSVSLKRGEVTKVPVWVKLYNVPVLAYSEDGLSLIATQIEIPKPSDKNAKANTIEENDDGFVEVKSRKKKKGADPRLFGGLRLSKPNSKVIWQQKKGGEAKGGSSASPSVSTNDIDNIQEFVSQASAVNFNQGNTSYRPQMLSNHVRPPGFPPVPNNQNLQRNNQSRFIQIKIIRIGGVSKEDFSAYVKANDAVMRNVQTQSQNMQNQLTNLTDLMTKVVNANTASTSNSGTLPSNTIANPRSDLKAITTRSGVSYDGP